MTKEVDLHSQPIFFIQSEGKGKFVRIVKEEIIYMECNQNYLCIHTNNGSHAAKLSLSQAIAILPNHQYIRVHKSFLVNLNHVLSIDGGKVNLSNGMKISLGRQYRKSFFDSINALLLKSRRAAPASETSV